MTKTFEEKIEHAAKSAHEANRFYCQMQGDHSQPPWDAAPEWQKASARAGVEQIAKDPATTPAQSHEGWMKQKVADGWVYGVVKNPDATPPTHPCMVPYEQLPESQRVKDSIFGAVVRAALASED